MSLDAFVFCDCFQRGRINHPPPNGVRSEVDGCGELVPQDSGKLSVETLIEFDNWLETDACAHRGGILLHRRIGNIALVELLRAEFARAPDSFPLILGRIVYNGSHAGDFLTLEDFGELDRELDRIPDHLVVDFVAEKKPVWSRPFRKLFIREWERVEFRRTALLSFREQFGELLVAARSVGKPIAF